MDGTINHEDRQDNPMRCTCFERLYFVAFRGARHFGKCHTSIGSLFAILLVLLMVAGCNRDRGDAQPVQGQSAPTTEPAPLQSATASQNQTISEPATQPTSQPTNTPVLSSPQQLIEAQKLYTYGNYAESRALFSSVRVKTHDHH